LTAPVAADCRSLRAAIRLFAEMLVVD